MFCSTETNLSVFRVIKFFPIIPHAYSILMMHFPCFITYTATMEAQLYSLMTEIKSSLPAITTTYENDDVIVWDCRTKRKNIISFQDLPTMLTLKPDPEAAYETIINEGYLELTPDTILRFSKHGMPTQYL